VTDLPVVETFVSLQGESTHAGRRCGFIRLAGCNLACSWCDTVYAAQGEGIPTPVDDLVATALGWNVDLVELTGGEPLIHPGAGELITRLLDARLQVLVETNGAVDIGDFDRRASYIVDYKLKGSGAGDSFAPGNFARLAPGDEVKFVVADRADYDEAHAVIASGRIPAGVERLLSPVWGALDPATLAGWMVADRIDARLNLPLHKIVWPTDPRGR
jgi:7-carboxy-7-deazaguanine synthase